MAEISRSDSPIWQISNCLFLPKLHFSFPSSFPLFLSLQSGDCYFILHTALEIEKTLKRVARLTLTGVRRVASSFPLSRTVCWFRSVSWCWSLCGATGASTDLAASSLCTLLVIRVEAGWVMTGRLCTAAGVSCNGGTGASNNSGKADWGVGLETVVSGGWVNVWKEKKEGRNVLNKKNCNMKISCEGPKVKMNSFKVRNKLETLRIPVLSCPSWRGRFARAGSLSLN